MSFFLPFPFVMSIRGRRRRRRLALQVLETLQGALPGGGDAASKAQFMRPKKVLSLYVTMQKFLLLDPPPKSREGGGGH